MKYVSKTGQNNSQTSVWRNSWTYGSVDNFTTVCFNVDHVCTWCVFSDFAQLWANDLTIFLIERPSAVITEKHCSPELVLGKRFVCFCYNVGASHTDSNYWQATAANNWDPIFLQEFYRTTIFAAFSWLKSINSKDLVTMVFKSRLTVEADQVYFTAQQ